MLISFSDKVGLAIEKEGLERSSRAGKPVSIVLKGKGTVIRNKSWNSPDFKFSEIKEQGEWIAR